MSVKHTFIMQEDFVDQRNGNDNSTRIVKNFVADNLDDLVDEFKFYLWNCGYTYVENVEVTKE